MVSKTQITQTHAESSSCSVFQEQPQHLLPPESISIIDRVARNTPSGWQLATSQRAVAACLPPPAPLAHPGNQRSAEQRISIQLQLFWSTINSGECQNNKARTPFPSQHSKPQDLRTQTRSRSVFSLLQLFRRFKSIHHNA